MGGKVADSGIPFVSQIEGEYQLNMQQAKQLERDAQYNAGQRRRAADQLMGQQIAAVGASGVELEGTPMEMIRADLVDAEIEAMNIAFAGKMQGAMMKRRASLQKQSGYLSLAKDGASMMISAGAFKGGTGSAAGKNAAMDARSTGTNGYKMSENSSAISNKGTEYIA